VSEAEALLLLFVSIGAALVPLITRRLKIPTAVMEIGFGLLLGVLASQIPREMVILDFLADLGFILLMFLAGLEIDFEKLRIMALRDILLAVCMYLVMIALSVSAASALGQPPFFSLVYFTTAIGLLFPVLREMGWTRLDLGQRYLIVGSIGEILSLGTFTVFAIYQRTGWSKLSFLHMGEILVFVILALVVHRFVKLAAWWFPGAARLFTQPDDAAERGIRGSLVFMFVFVALASFLNLEPIIGAFIGGAVFALVFKQREQMIDKIGGMAYGFFIPLFFIRVGLRFNLEELLAGDVLVTTGAAILIMLGVRLAGLVPMLFSSLSRTGLLGLPLATAFPLTLLIAVATYGMQEAILSRTQSSAVVLTAVITALVFPLLLRRLEARRMGQDGPEEEV